MSHPDKRYRSEEISPGGGCGEDDALRLQAGAPGGSLHPPGGHWDAVCTQPQLCDFLQGHVHRHMPWPSAQPYSSAPLFPVYPRPF